MSVIGAVLAATLAAAVPATPLFADDAPIRLAIQGPLSEIARSAETSSVPRDGTLALPGTAETHLIRLTPRGITRRKSETCRFPPLRVEFPQNPGLGSLFAGQRRLKLVTHCQPSEGFQQYLLLEYSAYRIFNLIDPTSFRVRLSSIDYAESGGRKSFNRLGFFIEDLDDAARRNAFHDANVGVRILVPELEPRQSARVAMFEYMIGNLDWSMRAGPEGDECCHNVRLLTAAPGRPPYIPLAYDFDYSGLVNAPYAVPPEGFKISSVRSRVYRGYCRHNAQALAAAAAIRARRPAIEALYGSIPQLSERSRARALAYLAGFFDEIATDASVRDKLLRRCVAG
ncbi:MAG: hypothetical protein ACR2FK_01265 [Sphingomicrobium sp.]